MWIVVATLLAKFNIEAKKDSEGKEVLPRMEFTTGITRYVLVRH